MSAAQSFVGMGGTGRFRTPLTSKDRSARDVFDELLEEAHKVAFKEAYDVGSRRRSATFDADKYARVLFSTMQSRAEARGHSEIAKSLAVVEANHATPGR